MTIDIKSVAQQNRIDWMAYPPRERTWIYVERTKGYWHTVCRKFTLNWEEARDLYGDVILLSALKHSFNYDEVYGCAFTTYMSRNLMLDIRRTQSRRLNKKKNVKITIEADIDGCKVISNGTLCSVTDKPTTGPDHETKVALRDGLAILKKRDPVAHDIFIDYSVHNQTKSLLAAKYRCTTYIVNDCIDASRRFLARYIGNE